MMFPYMIKISEIKRIQNKKQNPIVKHMCDDPLHGDKHINYYIKRI